MSDSKLIKHIKVLENRLIDDMPVFFPVKL